MAQEWIEQEANLAKHAEHTFKTVFSLMARLPALLDALEKPPLPIASHSVWPLILTTLAIALAIALTKAFAE